MNCYTPNAKCAPSRSCVATGRNSWQLEEAGNHVSFFPAKFKTYAEALAGQTDYFVGMTGKGVAPVQSPRGATSPASRITGRTAKPPARGISDKDYAANFGRFLRETARGPAVLLLVRRP